MRSARAAALVLGLALAAAAAQAQQACLPPSAPLCVDLVVGADKAQWETMCGRDVERYRKQTLDYVRCLDLERIAAERRASAVVERYNCKRRGGTYCP